MNQKSPDLSRRQFVRVMRDGAVMLLLPRALGCRAGDPEQPADPSRGRAQIGYELKFLAGEEAEVIEAMSARIFPSDETPGAPEARVVHFIDHMLATEDSAQQAAYREGVRRLGRLARARFDRRFPELTEREQDSVLTQMERREIPDWKESADFFSMVRAHTIEGMFADPRYHGNAGGVGWKLLGLDARGRSSGDSFGPSGSVDRSN